MLRRCVAWTLVSSLLCAGCVLEEVDLEGRACPCADGWTCDATRSVCVRGAGMDAGGTEAGDTDASVTDSGGTDSGRTDAAATDAAATDAGPLDGGSTDAAPSDAGPMDAGRSDAGPLDDTICDELSGALFCDGFETALLPWIARTEVDGTVTPSGARVYRGTRALDAETTAASGKASVTATLGAAVRTGDLYARGYFYVPSTLDSEGVSLLYLGESTSPYVGVALQLAADERTDVYVGPADRLAAGPRLAIPRDAWVCLQLHLQLAMRGRVEAWIDGAVTADESLVDTLPAGGIDRLITGIEFSVPTQLSARVYVDEVAVGPSPIPCD